MKTHDLIQGSAAWHAHRASHFNASDAPAMLGCSKYKNRTQLLQELKTGISEEVDAGTQRRFDDGHRFEALARPLAEKIIGEDLYPVTGTEGELSASFDGLTMDESTGFEHKTLNDQLRAALISDAGADALPKAYRVQMEQQCMVSGATRILFMASKWSGDEMVEEMHAWYEPDAELRAEILAGWQQFAADLAAYKPAPAEAPKPTAAARESLPALVVEAKGEITVSNLDAYKVKALAVIGSIPTKFENDQQFVDAKEDAKFCRDVQDAMATAKIMILGRMASIDEAIKAIDHISEVARRKAIDLENAVEAEEKLRKQKMLTDAAASLRAYIDGLNTRLGKPYMPAVPADFAGAIKNKRSVASMQDAIDTTLANAKIGAAASFDLIHQNLTTLQARSHVSILFPDEAQLVLKAPDDLAAIIAHRIMEHDKAIEAANAKAEEVQTVAAPAAAPAPSVTPITATVARQVVVEQQDVISAFLGSRTWGKGDEAKARAVLVEFEKFRAGYQLRKAA
ncbi:YqaJ viral recombinase family protein [Variovorax ginsengisoli]|uniref:YqaJ viral recombinase family protein n=1 Tax=Variovorax ginsengisoli TaxID=363844 RepID=A0ABT8S057_9BURK|nr:YqaJ viral recombinase family protein [Variovorax ginsengisoli]MDN8612748.1 YqaJ viral recombinase family protein [Variovorax ginsengisoli]MDO1531918.1 YqaJ viral recombinase family protein [Variovorax ginsengisoli]